MLIQRRYFDEELWEVVEEETARQSLEKFYLDASPLIEQDIANGETIYTDVFGALQG